MNIYVYYCNIGKQGETTEQFSSSSPEINISVDPLTTASSNSQGSTSQRDQSTSISTGILVKVAYTYNIYTLHMYICISYNIGKSALPDIYARCLRVHST